MATGSKKAARGSSSGKKRSSGSRSRSGSRTSSARRASSSKNTASRSNWGSEVFLFVVLIFCVILFVTNIGKGGAVGNGFSHFFFGLFGVMSYVFPVAFFLIVAFAVANRISSRNRGGGRPGRAAVKTLCFAVVFIFVCAICHIVIEGKTVTNLRHVFNICADGKTGGGILGAAVATLLTKSFGMVAAWVIIIIVLILCVVLITEKSLFRGISRKYADSKRHAPERAEHRDRMRQVKVESRDRARAQNWAAREEAAREKAARVDEERARRRSERHVSGVTDDTKLAPDKPKKTLENQNRAEGMSEVDMSNYALKEEVPPTPEEIPFEENVQTSAEDIPVRTGNSNSYPFEEDFSSFENEPDIRISGLYDDDEDGDDAFDVPAKPAVSKSKDSTANQGAKSTTKPEMKSSAKSAAKSSAVETVAEVAAVGQAVASASAVGSGEYVFPDIRLLKKGDPTKTGDSKAHLKQMSDRLQETLQTFGVNARVTNVICGPSVTQYEVQPEMGVKVSKIVNLADDIKLNLMVSDIRIEAPIPGKAAIGIEVPNKENVTVAFRDLVESPEFKNHKSVISFCAGKDIAGHVIVADIAKMPHLLIAGATGSGKSVCINTIIMSILFKATPEEVKLIMIDPKVVELSVYNSIPHLLIPVVTDPKKAAGALNWAVAEMTDRYNKFAEYGVRDMAGYNKKVDSIADIDGEDKPQKMPNIVIIVDELADLMMVAAGDVEDAICRLAQLARAAGIHLIIATQRPSVNVITGLIKANMPSRIAFSVTSGVDSRTILDMNGAEKLLGKGDMLFYPQGYAKPLRVQGAFVSDSEVAAVVDDIVAKNGQVAYNPDIENQVKTSEGSVGGMGLSAPDDGRDSYFNDAALFLIDKEKASIGMLQRNFKIGFNRAARIMDQLEEAGVVGPELGTKPRRVLMTAEEYAASQLDEE